MKSYSELKFKVMPNQLDDLVYILDQHYHNSDPYPEGVVDSVYFDTIDMKSFDECLDGSFEKAKFRVRGYGDGTFSQAHLKRKLLYEVHKTKAKLEPIRFEDLRSWSDLVAKPGQEDLFREITVASLQSGPLFPTARIVYKRKRFRAFDFRLTIDYDIRVIASNGVHPWMKREVHFPHHVLELKSYQKRPHIPLLGSMKLQQISFSKYMQGIFFLQGQDPLGIAV